MYIILFTEAHTCYTTVHEEKVYTGIRKTKNQLGIIKADEEGTGYNYFDDMEYINKSGDRYFIQELEVV